MVGAFRIVAPLGRGGMATVYEAYDTRLERAVALKVLPPYFLHDRSFARRFQQEARVVARLEHSAIVPIYASGTDDGIPWMSMRLMGGGNMGTLLERAPPDRVDALPILSRVAEALDYAHAHGVVHRDIKPTNILFDLDGQPSVGDFGLAQMLEGNPVITRTGTVLGTPSYMAPEQALGKGVDHRCDIYSLGIVAYEMLVGTAPFTDDSPVAVLLKHVNEPLPVSATGGLPAAVVRAIQKAAAKDPAERWPSAGHFVRALEEGFAVAGISVGVVPLSAGARAPRVRPSWLGARTIASAALLGAVALAGAAVTWVREDPTLTRRAAIGGASAIGPPAQAGAGADVQVSLPPASAPAPQPTRRQTEATTALSPSREVAPPQNRPQAPTPVLREDVSPTPPETPPATREREPQVARAAERENDPRVATPPPSPLPAGEALVLPPRRIGIVQPIYPDLAKAARLEGDVVLRVTVSADGSVGSVQVMRSPHRSLNAAATEAVRQSKYSPGSRNGVPEEATTSITVRFRLD
jgi:eukaryotic-like serine/threonine-protein kinase